MRASNINFIALIALTTLLTACQFAGPRALGRGRSAYNDVINRTEDEQLLSFIVRDRYDETAGLLAVTSVTANLRFSTSVGAEFGIGPRNNFDGNLVPLRAGSAYEENPTIVYSPLRGESFLRKMLAPISVEQALLLSRAARDGVEPLGLVIRRVNGLANPRYVAEANGGSFARFLALFGRLRDRGRLDLATRDGDKHVLVLHHTEGDTDANDFLALLGIPRTPPTTGPLILPIRSATGADRAVGIDLETPSPLEVIRMVGGGVDLPSSHVKAGLAQPANDAVLHPIRIKTSWLRPSGATIAAEYRGWWFYIDPADRESKQTYVLLRTLVGMRLDHSGTESSGPVLTVPVG